MCKFSFPVGLVFSLCFMLFLRSCVLVQPRASCARSHSLPQLTSTSCLTQLTCFLLSITQVLSLVKPLLITVLTPAHCFSFLSVLRLVLYVFATMPAFVFTYLNISFIIFTQAPCVFLHPVHDTKEHCQVKGISGVKL